jgi:hypothetical protein
MVSYWIGEFANVPASRRDIQTKFYTNTTNPEATI